MTLFIHLIFTSFCSKAFMIATFDSQKTVDYQRETDVIIVGYAGELGSGFLKAGLTLAHKTREQFPHRQIVFYSENRTKDFTASKHVMALGLHPLYFDSEPFTAKKLMKELLAFHKIHTIHVVAHTALENGIGLTDQTTEGRWNHKTPELEKIKMTSDGYIFLHGCNSGFLQAPEFSRRMGIPAFGSLNATNFQQPFDNEQWYFHDVQLYPPNVDFLTSNTLSFATPVDCSKGACFRLKPDYFAYNGFWGDFSKAGGLSFLKSFCTFSDDKAVRKLRCLSAMRQWMQIFPSVTALPQNPSLDQYKLAVKDYLCGTHPKKQIRQECFAKLEEAESNQQLIYSGFVGNSLKCDQFGPCNFNYSCDSSIHNCTVTAPKNSKPTTIIQEYLYYLEAFQ